MRDVTRIIAGNKSPRLVPDPGMAQLVTGLRVEVVRKTQTKYPVLAEYYSPAGGIAIDWTKTQAKSLYGRNDVRFDELFSDNVNCAYTLIPANAMLEPQLLPSSVHRTEVQW